MQLRFFTKNGQSPIMIAAEKITFTSKRNLQINRQTDGREDFWNNTLLGYSIINSTFRDNAS